MVVELKHSSVTTKAKLMRRVLVQKERGKERKGQVQVAPEREREREREPAESSVLRVSIPSLKVGIIGGFPRKDLNRIHITCQACSFRIMISPDWLALGEGLISHCIWS